MREQWDINAGSMRQLCVNYYAGNRQLTDNQLTVAS